MVQLSWEAPGKTISYNSSYNTSVGGLVNNTVPRVSSTPLVCPFGVIYRGQPCVSRYRLDRPFLLPWGLNILFLGFSYIPLLITFPQYAAWINQLNVTYSALNITGNNTATTIQPNGTVFADTDDSIINGTMFLGLTDTNLYVTPYNLSLLNDHIIAWGLYQAN
jgi:hypothetical protein